MDTVKVNESGFMNRLREILLKEYTFPILVALASAAIFAGTHMFVAHHVGAFNEIYIVQMLDEGLQGGDYAAAAGFAAGFLIARILEGPLVGVLDIGGSLMTGVGIGIPALMLASGFTLPVENFFTCIDYRCCHRTRYRSSYYTCTKADASRHSNLRNQYNDGCR